MGGNNLLLTIQEIERAFRQENYISDEDIATVVYLALKLNKPLLIEGEAGVGKTEIAKVLAKVLDTNLIRLQCYEGIDENKALYEWNYQKQLLKIQLGKEKQVENELEKDLFSESYLLERPLLKALRCLKSPVLLIDEIDKVQEEFEAFLLEILSEYQVSIPELGTVTAQSIPFVILTSNNTRSLTDALKRRCLYLYLDYPSWEKELNILKARIPGIGEMLAQEVVTAIQKLRNQLKLRKKPSIAETIDWGRALISLEVDRLTPELVEKTLSTFLKIQQDLKTFSTKGGASWLLEKKD